MKNYIKENKEVDTMLNLSLDLTTNNSVTAANPVNWIVASDESVKELIEKGEVAIDLSQTKLNNWLARRKPTTLLMVEMPYIEICQVDDDKFIYKATIIKVPYNRLVRANVSKRSFKEGVLKFKNRYGKEVQVKINKSYLTLERTPFLYMEFVGSDDKRKSELLDTCINAIENGIVLNGVRYKYVLSSASQLRQLKGVFVREDYRIPNEYLSRFNTKDEKVKEYVEFLKTLRGEEAVLEIMTYGAYSHYFSGRYNEWLKTKGHNVVVEKKEYNLAKFLARVGLSLTSSIPFGRNWRVKKIGEVRFVWSEHIEKMYIDMSWKDELSTIKEFWKEQKCDGQNLIRASKVIKNFKRLYGIKLTKEEVIGKLIQFRWAGVKGTALVVDDYILDMCRDPEGRHIYKGYDLIVEENSWKHDFASEFYHGKAAPELELVHVSKFKYSSNLNYQFVQALDGPSIVATEYTVDMLKAVVDEFFGKMKEAMVNSTTAKEILGIVFRGSKLDSLGIDEQESLLKSKITKMLEEEPSIVYDPYWRRKFMSLFSKEKDEASWGKLVVQGATRYIITDPIAMLRTDLMDEKGNIVITHPEQVGLRNSAHVYWANRAKDAVLFRSPCVHPGEPQKVKLVGLEDIPEFVETAFGKLPVKEIYNSINELIVLNGFSNILEALGGADTDGDTALCCTDSRVVGLRNPYRPTVFVKVPDGNFKGEINPDTIKAYMIRSLKSDGIGLITNYATTWRDMQSYAAHLIEQKEKGVKVKFPKEIIKALKKAKKAAEDNERFAKEDPSIEALINMDINKPKSVYMAINKVLYTLRYLQEMAINTAKSGLFVEFNHGDPERNGYEHLMLKIRAGWHKEGGYKSQSVMGRVSRYVMEQWRELEKWASKTAKPLSLGLKEEINNYTVLSNFINKMKAQYGNEVKKLTDAAKVGKLTEEQFSQEFQGLVDKNRITLLSLANLYGLDAVVMAAYDASYGNGKKSGSGNSFIWQCFFDEFRDTVRYLKTKKENEPVNIRLYAARPVAEYAYHKFELNDIVNVVDNKVIYKDKVIAEIELENGEYNAVSINGKLYLKVVVPAATLNELTASLKGLEFNIVGFKYYKDNNGQELDKARVVEMLTNDMGQNIIKFAPNKFDAFGTDQRVECHVRVSVDEEGNPVWAPFGCLEFSNKLTQRALNNKAVKVVVVADNQSSRVRVRVEKVSFNYNHN